VSAALAGTGSLTRLALRRDRVLVVAWVLGLVVMAAASALATVDLYPTEASRVEAADALNRSQALVALYGRIHDTASLGAIAMWKMGGIGAIFVAMLTVVTVVRHTRGDEEAGRLELLGATAIGRQAPLAAAFAEAAVVNLALGVLTAVALALSGLPAGGSVAFGAAWAGVGLAFAAVAGLLAQVAPAARTATGLSALVVGVVYLVRAVGDAASVAGPRWLTWLSPFGWGQQLRPYAGNRWWVLVITLAFAVLAGAAALVLTARRDLGSGLLPERGGSPEAAGWLRTPLALAWRLHRGALAAWSISFLLVGALIGAMASSAANLLTSSNAQDFITRLGGVDSITEAFLSLELGFAGIVASAYAMSVVMRLPAEEQGGRAEPVLATAVSRLRWAGGHLAIAVAGATLLLAAAGLGAGIAHGLQVGDAGQVAVLVGAALARLPAALVLAGLVVALYGLSPRLAVAGWAALAGFVVLGELGPLLRLRQWVMDLSPFAHAPSLPGSAVHPASLVVLTLLAVALGAAGLVAFRHRDLR